ncbi:MAG: 6-pyruvoyl-tetrahydropterin synthase-related protein [Candidatus Levyibacteriota bacterium]
MKRLLFLFIFIVFSLIPIIGFFHGGLPLTHDGQDHVARIANFYENLSQGVIIPRWAPNLNWGYGHPILEFLYPLPSYIASFFHFLGFSLIDSTKLVFGLGMVLSTLFMFLWLSTFLGKLSAFFGAILYSYAPYRFVELYVRGDIGENLAFAFIPLTLFFVYRFYQSQNYKHIFFGSLSLALLILSHNAISLMFMPFLIFYCFYLVWQSPLWRLFATRYLLFAIFGFGLSAFFWIPGLFEAKYTLRNIVTAGEYLNRFANPRELLYGSWSYGGSGQFSLQLGIIQWISLILSPLVVFYFYKRKEKKYLFVLGLIIYTFFAIFFMLSQSNFIWLKAMLLQNFQFPWRFIAITVFSTSVLGAISISVLSKKIKFILVGILLVLILLISKDYWQANGYFYKPDSFFTDIYNGTTDTGESAPIWSIRFMETRAKEPLEVISGLAKINQIKRTSVNHFYNVEALEKTRLLENTLYFPGWEILVDKRAVSIQFQDPSFRGLMTFQIDKGKHTVEVVYKETKLRMIADIISFISLIILLFGLYLVSDNKLFVKKI